MEDKILVFKCRQGSGEALRRIYEKYQKYLFILAIALCKNEHTAEDAVQEAFVGFAERAAEFELRGSLKAYLATCVANRVRDVMRARQNKAVSIEEDCVSAVDLREPIGNIVCNEEMEQLSEALAELPYEQREVIALRIYGQMRFGVIAKSLGISVNTAKGRYRYGIDKLRSMLNDEVKK